MPRIAGLDVSFIDGKGIAFVVYFQGCSLRCRGCHNPSLQDPDGGFVASIHSIMNAFDAKLCDSVVFMGGEPLEQEAALLELASQFAVEKWLYTGYTDISDEVRGTFDVIVAGPYVQSLATDSFPASSNQVVIRRGYEVTGDV